MQHGTLLQNSSFISSRNSFNNICLGKGSHFPGKFHRWYNLLLHLFTSQWCPWIWTLLSVLPLEFPQSLLFPFNCSEFESHALPYPWDLLPQPRTHAHCCLLSIAYPILSNNVSVLHSAFYPALNLYLALAQ